MKVEGIEGLIENLDKITSVFGTGVIRISEKIGQNGYGKNREIWAFWDQGPFLVLSGVPRRLYHFRW